MMKSIALGMTLLATTALAAEPVGKRIVFVACPMVRNTELPCWMSAHENQLYFLTEQTDLGGETYPPWLGHKALIEGTVTDKQMCGGIVLEHVTASVLPEPDVSCNTILPAQGFASPPGERGTGPSGVRGGAPPAPPPRRPPAPPPPGPYKAETFTATFNADTTRLWRPAQAALRQAVTFATYSKATAVEVTGYRAAIKLTNGETYVEDAAIAQERAEIVAEALEALGMPKTAKISVKWVTRPEGGKGDERDAQARKTVIRVIPGAA